MRQENADATQTDSHRYQLNHRTHRSRAYPTQHQGSPPILGCNAEKWFRRIRKAAELSQPCDRSEINERLEQTLQRLSAVLIEKAEDQSRSLLH